MPLILGTNSIKDTGYAVANSCRFNRTDSPKMSKTLGAPSDADKWTFSAWVKLTDFGTDRFILSLYTDDNNETAINFENGNSINFYNYISGSYAGRLVPNQKLRDPSAWYHLVAVFDSGNGTAGNRMRLYLNGSEITSFATDSNPNQDQDSKNADGVTCVVGRAGTDDYNFGGYMAEVCFCDGQAYAASDFGEFDEDSPTIWKPKKVSGLTFGNNGFYLDFEDSSNLGNDKNGGTDLTEANLAATGQAVDSPTNNFCTINPLYFRTGRTAATISEGNLKCVHSDSGGNTPAWGTFLLTAGSWYWEVKVSVGNYSYIGIWQPEYNDGDMSDALDGIVIYRQDGNKQAETAATAASYGDTYTGGSDIVSVAVNCDTGTIWFAKNGTWQNSATEAEIEAGTTTNSAYTGKSFSKGIIPSISAYSGATHEYNFGNPTWSLSSAVSDENGYGSFEYSVPDGFLAVCSKNLGSDGG